MLSLIIAGVCFHCVLFQYVYCCTGWFFDRWSRSGPKHQSCSSHTSFCLDGHNARVCGETDVVQNMWTFSAAVINVGVMPDIRGIMPPGVLQHLKILFGSSFTSELGCNRRRSTPLSSSYIN